MKSTHSRIRWVVDKLLTVLEVDALRLLHEQVLGSLIVLGMRNLARVMWKMRMPPEVKTSIQWMS